MMVQTDDAVVTGTRATTLPGQPRLWPLGVVLLPFLLLAIWRAFHGAGVTSDDFGQYLMHAQALAEGRPYGDIAYIYSKYARLIGPRLAPPGLPATLAPFIAVFGSNLLVLKTVMLVFGVAFVTFAGLYFARFVDWKLGLGVALLCALSPDMVHGASQILTDLPFAALIWVTIYVIDRPGDFSIKKIVAVTFLGAYAVAFRSTGVALVPALVLFAILRHKDYRWRPVVPVAVWTGGVLALALIANVGAAAVVYLHPKAFYEWIVVEKLPLQNIAAYAEHMVASHTYPFPWDRANEAFHVLTVGLMLVGLAAWLPRNFHRFAVVFTVCYALMLVVLPISQPRYLWPLYPVFVFGMLNGARVVINWLTKAPQLAASAALTFAIVLVPPAALNVINDPHPTDLTDVADVSELFAFLEGRPDSESLRVTFFKPRTLGWETGIPAMGPPRGEPHCILGELGAREITHVITGRLDGSQTNSHMRRTIRAYPGRFTKEFENPTFTVYAFERGTDALTYEQNPECRRS